MRQLHVIGFTSDHGGLLLAAKQGAKTGSYFLKLDSAVFDQIETARLARSGVDPSEPRPPRVQVESALSPREIQSRIRAGRTVNQVASEAGVSVEWIDRFAAPVLAEQIAAAERAGRAYLTTTRRGTSDRPLASAVARNLAARGVRMEEGELNDAWAAHHLVDGEWLVSLRFRSRGRSVVAQWIYNATNNSLISQNRLGSELGYVERPRGAADPSAIGALPPLPVSTIVPTSRRRPARKASARKATTRKATVGKATTGRAAAGRAAAAKVSVITTAASPTKRAASSRSAVKSTATKSTAAKSARAPGRAVKSRAKAKTTTKKRATTAPRPAKRTATPRPTTSRTAKKAAGTRTNRPRRSGGPPARRRAVRKA